MIFRLALFIVLAVGITCGVHVMAAIDRIASSLETIALTPAPPPTVMCQPQPRAGKSK